MDATLLGSIIEVPGQCDRVLEGWLKATPNLFRSTERKI